MCVCTESLNILPDLMLEVSFLVLGLMMLSRTSTLLLAAPFFFGVDEDARFLPLFGLDAVFWLAPLTMFIRLKERFPL